MPLPIRALAFAFVLTLAFGVVTPASTTADPLLFIERRAQDDLARLQALGVDTFHESNAGFVAVASGEERETLRGLGFTLTVIDDDGRPDQLAVLAIRPGTDIASLRALGRVLLERENWALVRLVAPVDGAPHAETSCIAGTLLPPTPLSSPRPLTPGVLRRAPGATDALTPNPLIQKIVNGVDEAAIDQYWVELTDNPPAATRYSTSQGCRDAANYCLGVFQEIGVPAELETWSAPDAPNVVATRLGAIDPDRIAIVVGHLDDLPSSGLAPGANDNASGTVNVLESARAMQCYAFRNTIRYLAVTGEEQGLRGSRAYASAAAARGDDIIGVINMDMIGWEGDGIPATENVDINYNGPSQWLGELFRDAASAYGTGIAVDAFFCPSLTASDHQSFWEKGWPAICGITDNENYCGHGGNYPYYHQSTDTIENSGDPSLFYGVVRTSVATLAELARPFKVTFERDAYACGSTATIVLGDADLDLLANTEETVALVVTSDTEPQGETVVLRERGLSSMLFDGSIALGAVPAAAGDGVLSVAAGDVLRVSYVDALDCDGATGVSYGAEAVVDCTLPVIDGVDETGVSDVAATIVWQTDEPATSSLVWGPSVPPGARIDDDALVAAHQITLQNLEPCTVYYYEVRSTDEAGNEVVSDRDGQYHYFETLGDFGDGLVACHAGRVTIEADAYACADSLPVKLTDLDLNRSVDAIDTATVLVTSTTEPGGELLVLTETAPNSATFTASIVTAPGAPSSDGVLQTSPGDLLTASYRDGDDGTGRAASSFDTALADCSGPAISGLVVQPADHVRVSFSFATDEPSTTVIEYGPTPALGKRIERTALETAHVIDLSDADICTDVYFTVRSADAFGHESSIGGASPLLYRTHGIPGLYWRADFESGAPSWTLGGEWQVGAPQGRGGSSGAADPTAAYNRNAVLGHDLNGTGAFPGDYEPNKTESAWTPFLNASSWVSTRLIFYRKLVTGSFDTASVWLHTNAGRPLWSSDNGLVSDAKFLKQSFDIGSLADGYPALRVRFEQKSNASGNYSGWNLDEVIFKDARTPDHAACGGCTTPPAFPGVATAVDESPCAPGGIRLSWSEAPAWGSGTGGRYAIYRSTEDAFVPSPATLVASGVTGTTFVDSSAPANVTLHYIVRAENDETCGDGPANGGATDANLRRIGIVDTTAQTTPDAIAALRVTRVGEAHVRLDWAPNLNAASYRVLRAPNPQAASFAPEGQASLAFWEDDGAAADGQTHFYLVRGVDACGNEGP